jgi:excisionase family DNA binding protein
MSPLLSISDVAKFLAISDDTVRRLVARGELPAIRLPQKLGRGTLRFNLKDIEKFIEQHKS